MQLCNEFDGGTATRDYPIIRYARRAMATVFEVLLPFGQPSGDEAAEAVLDQIDDLEDQLSIFRPHSEVSRINARAAEEAIAVEANLFALLVQSAALTRQTHGGFDIATGALSRTWGFLRRQGRIPTAPERAEALAKSGMRWVDLDVDRRTVRFKRSGLEINLGGIGKGYALDRSAALLRERYGIDRALVHGGRSSVLALSPPPGQPRGWPIALPHPEAPGRRLGTIYLAHQALGTSAATYQSFEYNGHRLGHILDPRTGWPAGRVRQASVLAPTAAEADALSTACFVLGMEGAARLSLLRPEIGIILLPTDQDEPVTFNLSRRVFEPEATPASMV